MIKIALLGCGRISKRHSDLLGFGEIKGAKLVAVCDKDFNKAKAIGQVHDVPAFDSLESMIEKVDIDVVTILTESGNHAKHAIQVAKYKKHVVVEKPMALTLDDADSMIRTCSENGVRLFVVKQNRFNTPIKKLKEAVENDKFGKLVLGTVRVRWCRKQSYYNQDSWRGTWSMDGGVLTNQASHHIDLLTWIMGDVESVFAKSSTSLVDIEAEDTGIVVLKFRNGALGIIEATTAARPKDLEGSISVLGEKGTVEVGGFAVNKLKTWNFEGEEDDNYEQFSENPPNVYGFGHKEYYDHVVNCISNNQSQMVDGFEGRKSLELISAIYESIETGREVFMRFKPKRCRLGTDL